jgi:ABC-2 type transport system permease protein
VSRARTNHRRNALLTGVLLALVLVLGNRLARGRLDLRVDVSEERLSEPSPVAERMLASLADTLHVRAFFTGRPRLGVVQIAKRRLVEELDVLEAHGGGRVELEFRDPNDSSEAREEARALGIAPVPIKTVQGTSEVSQDTWFGLVLRYRGREEVLPFVLPQTFESAVLAALWRLTREALPTVGFLAGRGDGTGEEFLEIRRALEPDHRVREVLDLELGEAVPDDVAVLVVAGPRELHPRAVFAVDQFLQRGGRALFLVDRARVDLGSRAVEPVTTGLEDALAAWGALPSDGLVFDLERSNRITTHETLEVGGATISGGEQRMPYPFWPNVRADGLDGSNPVTARIEGADLFWAGSLAAEPRDGLERVALLSSSPQAWLVEPAEALDLDPRSLRARETALQARGGGERHAFAIALAGRFPSPFEAGAPAPLDPIRAAIERSRGTSAADAAQPDGAMETGEPVLSRAAATEIVVVADADWVASERFLTPRNLELFLGLVDWLALEEDLLALRARQPKARTLVDFLEEERRSLGLSGPRAELGPDGTDGSKEIASLEEEADLRAAARRWRWMGLVLGGSIVGALALGFAARLACGPGPLRGARGARGGA